MAEVCGHGLLFGPIFGLHRRDGCVRLASRFRAPILNRTERL